MRQVVCALAGVLIVAALPSAQPVFTGAEIFPPEEFAALIQRDYDKYGKIVKEVGVKVD